MDINDKAFPRDPYTMECHIYIYAIYTYILYRHIFYIYIYSMYTYIIYIHIFYIYIYEYISNTYMLIKYIVH